MSRTRAVEDYCIVIPARYASSRLPGKPLIDIAGKPLIQHVWLRACETEASQIIIATDDERIKDAALGFGAEVCLTQSGHESGTDRCNEVRQLMDWSDEQIIVNLQGDEPLMPAQAIQRVAMTLAASSTAQMATLAAPGLTAAELENPNVVKVVCNDEGLALYFSRAPIPWQRAEQAGNLLMARRHVGIYAYRGHCLKTLAAAQPAALELSEMLEQLRALALGLPIAVAELASLPAAGVDTPEDLTRVTQLLQVQTH